MHVSLLNRISTRFPCSAASDSTWPSDLAPSSAAT